MIQGKIRNRKSRDLKNKKMGNMKRQKAVSFLSLSLPPPEKPPLKNKSAHGKESIIYMYNQYT